MTNLEQLKQLFADDHFRYTFQTMVRHEVQLAVADIRDEVLGYAEDIKNKVNHIEYIQEELKKAGLIEKLDTIITKIKQI